MENSNARAEARRFARRLWVTLALAISGATALTVWVVRAQVTRSEAESVRVRFAAEFGASQAWRAARTQGTQAQVRRLAGRPRLHAALEDDALDLLYTVARDELQELRDGRATGWGMPAVFHRFLDQAGREISPGPDEGAGEVPPAARDLIKSLKTRRETSWGLAIDTGEKTRAWELVAVPFFSTADQRLLGTLVMGFSLATELDLQAEPAHWGAWSEGRLHAPLWRPEVAADLKRNLTGRSFSTVESAVLLLGGDSWLVSRQLANADSGFPPVWELRLASLAPLERRLSLLTWKIFGAGAALAATGWLASGWLSGVFAAWFGRVAQRLEGQRRRRERAEWQLERTTHERDRAARFAADASHQLKTPVAVLQAGLGELAATPAFPREQLAEVDDLLRQTERLGHIIDDLLLLAKLDAGLIAASEANPDLAGLIERALDDASAYPGAEAVTFNHDIPSAARGIGEPGHLMLILQNLLENAVKYGPPNGVVAVAVVPVEEGWAVKVRSVSKAPVPADAAERIFERFHRGTPASGVPGYGLGLNLARQLARLHGGDLRLVKSDAEATVFELRLRRG